MLCKKQSTLSQKVLCQIEEQNQKIEKIYEKKVKIIFILKKRLM
jgi:hypothetical protein